MTPAAPVATPSGLVPAGARVRPSASIKWVGRSGHEYVRDLTPGERSSFGGCSCRPWDVAVAADGAGHVAGAVTARSDHWRVDNLSPVAVLLVEDLEDPQQFVRVPGSRQGVVIPFELARITAAGPGHPPLLTVFGPEPSVAVGPGVGCPVDADEGETRHLLDPGTRYFAVLRALCESQHAGPGHPVPTSAAIARRLAEAGVRLSPRAVDHHIDYLVRRLRLAPPTGSVQRSWKKEVLAGVALRQGLLDIPA
ncbi:hypothetical protein [Streptomyces sp. NPDC085466]|uniref:hypothetical protein n=1 Tax=Streptomyces sp. NPDC085466 TaxID=3365725 RepID=UPI0037D3E71E